MFLHETDYCFNQLTGEIFHYSRTPMRDLGKDTEVYIHYTKSRDEQELIDKVKQYKERRYNELSYHFNKDRLGKWYIPLLKLCSKITYFNIGFYCRNEVALILGVNLTSLNKTLNKFVKCGLLKYTGKGLTLTNQIRIEWSPLSAWKGWLDSPTRGNAIQSWYKGYFKIEDIPVEDKPVDAVKEFIDIGSIVSPDPYVCNHFNLLPKDRFRKLISLSDAEFELYLVGE